MSTTSFDEFDTDVDLDANTDSLIPEIPPSKKLERRRKIEELFEEKRLREELEEFG